MKLTRCMHSDDLVEESGGRGGGKWGIATAHLNGSAQKRDTASVIEGLLRPRAHTLGHSNERLGHAPRHANAPVGGAPRHAHVPLVGHTETHEHTARKYAETPTYS